MRESKDEKKLREIIDKMFEIAGHDLRYEDVKGRKDNWYQQYTMTEAQRDEWRDWSIKYLKKRRFFRPDLEWGWINLYCGLTDRPNDEKDKA